MARRPVVQHDRMCAQLRNEYRHRRDSFTGLPQDDVYITQMRTTGFLRECNTRIAVAKKTTASALNLE
jgi:hypothetical protein